MTIDEQYKRGVWLMSSPQTEAEGMRLLEAACDAGSTRAATTLGLHYLNLMDHDTANRYFEKGAAKGDRDCLYYLAEAYRTGQGKQPNAGKAYKLLQKAIKRGKRVPPSVVSMHKQAAEAERPWSFIRRFFG